MGDLWDLAVCGVKKQIRGFRRPEDNEDLDSRVSDLMHTSQVLKELGHEQMALEIEQDLQVEGVSCWLQNRKERVLPTPAPKPGLMMPDSVVSTQHRCPDFHRWYRGRCGLLYASARRSSRSRDLCVSAFVTLRVLILSNLIGAICVPSDALSTFLRVTASG